MLKQSQSQIQGQSKTLTLKYSQSRSQNLALNNCIFFTHSNIMFKGCTNICFLDGCFLDDCFLNGYFLYGYFFSLSKTALGETGCLGNLYFLLTGCLSIQFFDLPQHSQLGHLWLPTPHCASHPTFTQSARPPLVTYPSLYFPPNLYIVN